MPIKFLGELFVLQKQQILLNYEKFSEVELSLNRLHKILEVWVENFNLDNKTALEVQIKNTGPIVVNMTEYGQVTDEPLEKFLQEIEKESLDKFSVANPFRKRKRKAADTQVKPLS